MELLVKIITLILYTLIKIGDGVLWIIGLFIQTVLRSIAGFSFFLTRGVKKLSFPVSSKKERSHKKTPKVRRITLFPLPLFAKFKYFLAGTIFSFTFLFIPLLSLVFLQDLPHPRMITLGQIPQTTKIYDRNGTLLYQIYAAENRTVVPLTTIPAYLKQATIAIEDKDFYTHPGFDITAIIRSAVENLQGNDLQGGSTITQQLIKSALLTPETSVQRKIKELILAFWAERIYTKNQILEMYFNQIPYGGTAWGAEAAAEVYFDKKVNELDLAESAFLAGIPRAPTIYSPYGETPTIWKKRQKDVLRRMQGLGYITKTQEEEAAKQELEFQPARVPLHAPHFVMYVRDYLAKKYGLAVLEKGGLTVTTSLDLPLQEKVQKIVSDEVSKNAYLNLTNGASLVTNPKNGDVLAMVGSKDFSESESGNVNLTTSLRQPGSSIKLVTYATALEQGFTAATILDDSPVTYSSPGGPSYSPVNYDGKSHGRVPLRVAFGNSFNITAVKTLNQVGIPAMVEKAKKMGIKSWKSPDNYGLSLTLGSAEASMVDMATVYGTVANQGVRVNANPVLKITDSKGNVLEEKDPVEKEDTTPFLETITGQRALSEEVAYIISDILADDGARSWAFGPNSLLRIPGKTVSVKTGTSDNKRDNWTIGFTPSYVVAVWVGNNNNAPMSQSLASGITGAAPIWNKVMTLLVKDKPDEKQPVPSDLIKKPCMGRAEYFVKGTENSVNCAYVLPPSVTGGPTTTQQPSSGQTTSGPTPIRIR